MSSERGQRAVREAHRLVRSPDPYPPAPHVIEVLSGWAKHWSDEVALYDELAATVLRRRRRLIESLAACHHAINGSGMVGSAQIFWPPAFRSPRPVAGPATPQLRGAALRAELANLLAAMGTSTIAELVDAIRLGGATPRPPVPRTVSDALRVMLRRGEVHRIERGRYRLSEASR